MAKLSNPYQCDIGSCQQVKGESNHWFLIPKNVVRTIFRGVKSDGLTILEWDKSLAETDEYKYVCSDSCAQKALQEWLDEAKARATERQQEKSS